MLDLARAFDTIGHKHIQHTLNSLPIPNNLCCLLQNLMSSNAITIEANKKYTKTIRLQKGVAQGSPLSPTIFNLCQDFVLKHIADPSVSEIHGFQLLPDVGNISICGFADDTVIIDKNMESARNLVDMVTDLFSSVGMKINHLKSHVINIEKGVLTPKY